MQKRYIPIAVLLMVLLILLAHFSGRALAVPASFTYAEEKKTVYLTFDDGPSDTVTVPVLDTLKEENVKATFFVVGERARSRKEILKRMVREGHTVGVHSMTHRYKDIYASDEAFIKDVSSCAGMIEKITGVKPHVYRFPGGSFSHKPLRKVVKDMGYRVVDWNAVCGDEEIGNADARTLTKRSVESSGGRKTVVLLLHDTAPHLSTAEALPMIIGAFRERGYSFSAF